MIKKKKTTLGKLEIGILKHINTLIQEKRGAFVEDIVKELYSNNEIEYKDIPRSFKVSVRRAIHSLNGKNLIWCDYRPRSEVNKQRELVCLPQGWYYKEAMLTTGREKVKKAILQVLNEVKTEERKKISWHIESELIPYVSKEYLVLKKEGKILRKPGEVSYAWLVYKVASRINGITSNDSIHAWTRTAISRALQELLDCNGINGRYILTKPTRETPLKRKGKRYMVQLKE